MREKRESDKKKKKRKRSERKRKRKKNSRRRKILGWKVAVKGIASEKVIKRDKKNIIKQSLESKETKVTPRVNTTDVKIGKWDKKVRSRAGFWRRRRTAIVSFFFLLTFFFFSINFLFFTDETILQAQISLPRVKASKLTKKLPVWNFLYPLIRHPNNLISHLSSSAILPS